MEFYSTVGPTFPLDCDEFLDSFTNTIRTTVEIHLGREGTVEQQRI